MQSFTAKVENKKHLKTKKKSKRYFLGFFIILLLVSIAAVPSYLYVKGHFVNISVPVIQEEAQPEFITQTSYFTAQTKFQSLKDGYSIEELSKQKLYFSDTISTVELDELKILLNLDQITKTQSGYDNYKALAEGSIVIVYP